MKKGRGEKGGKTYTSIRVGCCHRQQSSRPDPRNGSFPNFPIYSAAAVTMRLVVLKGADHLSFIRRLFDV